MEAFKATIESFSIEDIINNLDNLCSSCNQLYAKSNFQGNDVRKKVFYNLGHEIQHLGISFHLSKYILESEYPFNNLKLEERQVQRNTFLDYSKENLIFRFFSYTEAYLREIAKQKEITAQKINKIFIALSEKTELRLTSNEVNLWKIFSYLRNSFHNMGHFIFEDNPILYKELEYKFIKNNLIEYASINHILYFVEEILENIILKININTEDIEYIPCKEINVLFIDSK